MSKDTLSAGKVSLSVIPDSSKFVNLLGSALAGEEGAFSRIGKDLGGKLTMGAVAGLATMTAFAVKNAVQMSQTDALIQGHAQISAKAAQSVGDAFLKTAGQSTFSGKEMADAFAPVAGVVQSVTGHILNNSDALKVMHASEQLAEAGGISLSDSTSTLAGVMRAYGIGLGGVSGASNILFNTSRLTGIGISDVANAADKLHARLGAASPTLKDTATLVLDLAQHGVTGTRSLMLMQTGLTTLLSGGKNTNFVLKALGVNVYDANGKFVGMQNVLSQLSPKLAGMTDQQRRAAEAALFGKGAAGALNATILAGAAGYAKAAVEVTSKNAVDKAAEAQQSTLQAQVKKLHSAYTDITTYLGEKVIPIITSVIQWLFKHKVAIEVVAAVITGIAIKAMVSWVAEVVSGVAKMGVQIAIMVSKWVGLGATEEAYQLKLMASSEASTLSMVKATAKQIAALATTGAKWVWTGAQSLFSAENMARAWAIAMGPVGIAIALIATIATIVVLNWTKIKDITIEIWNAVYKFISGLVSDVVDFIKTHWQLLVAIITGPIGIVVIELAKHWKAIYDGVKTVVTDVINFFKALPGDILKGLGDLGSLLLGAGKEIMHGLVKGIKGLAMAPLNAVKDAAKGILSGIKGFFGIASPSKVMTDIGQYIMDGLTNGIKNGTANASAAATAAAKKVIAEHAKITKQLATENTKVETLYTKMNTVTTNALASRSKLIATESAKNLKDQNTYAATSLALNKAFTDNKFTLDRGYAEKKAALEQTYNDSMAAAQKSYDDAAVADKQKHADALAKIETDYQDQIISLNQAAATKRQSIVQQSIDLLTSSFSQATTFDVGTLFTGNGNSISGLVDSLKKQLNDAKTLATNAGALAAQGYSQTFIQQVVAQGPAIGNQMSAAILNATPDTAAQLKDLYSQLNDVSSNGVTSLATNMNSGTTLATKALTDSYAQVGTDLTASLTQAYADMNKATLAENISFSDTMAASLKTLNDAKASALQTLTQGLATENQSYNDSLSDMNKTLTDGLATASKTLADSLAANVTAFNTSLDALELSATTKMNGLNATLQKTAALMASLGDTSGAKTAITKAPTLPQLVTSTPGSLDSASSAARSNAISRMSENGGSSIPPVQVTQNIKVATVTDSAQAALDAIKYGASVTGMVRDW